MQITDLKFTMDALTRGPYLTGLTGAQLYVSVDRDIAVNTAIGHASEGRAMTPETILPWCCCSKLPTVLAAARIFADTGTALDSRVQDIVPEYGQAGKQDVTFEQLLSHTVPYRTWGTQPSMDDVRALRGMQAADALARVCSEPLSAPPGTEAVYTAIASWHVLATAIERLARESWEDAVSRYVFSPLGITRSWPVMTPPVLAEHAHDLGRSYYVKNDAPAEVPFELSPDVVSRRSAGSGFRGPAREMARSVECLLHGGAGPCGTVISADMAEELKRPRRVGLEDRLFAGLDASWGWGFCTDPLVFGLPPKTQVVGHTGCSSSFVCTDLDRGITISYISNAFYRDTADRSRKWGIARAVYKDLGIIRTRSQRGTSRSGAAPRPTAPATSEQATSEQAASARATSGGPLSPTDADTHE